MAKLSTFISKNRRKNNFKKPARSVVYWKSNAWLLTTASEMGIISDTYASRTFENADVQVNDLENLETPEGIYDEKPSSDTQEECTDLSIVNSNLCKISSFEEKESDNIISEDSTELRNDNEESLKFSSSETEPCVTESSIVSEFSESADFYERKKEAFIIGDSSASPELLETFNIEDIENRSLETCMDENTLVNDFSETVDFEQMRKGDNIFKDCSTLSELLESYNTERFENVSLESMGANTTPEPIDEFEDVSLHERLGLGNSKNDLKSHEDIEGFAKRRVKKPRIEFQWWGSSVIEGEFERGRRVTRMLVKTTEKEEIQNVPGRLVWGRYQGCWWPGIIINAEDAGMLPTPGCRWVCWVGESQISNLNEEKCIQPFEKNAEARLLAFFRNPTKKKAKIDSRASVVKLLRERFNTGPMMRPYNTWIQKYVLPHTKKLEDLVFFPYPSDIECRLSELKQINEKRNQNFLLEQEQERSSKSAKKPLNKKCDKSDRNLADGVIPISEQNAGLIVWAKMDGFHLWPGVIADYRDLKVNVPKFSCQWIIWYGDLKHSQVDYRSVSTFEKGMENMLEKIKSLISSKATHKASQRQNSLFLEGVLHASMDYCLTKGYQTHEWTMDDVFKWFDDVQRGEAQGPEISFDQKSVEVGKIYSPRIYDQIMVISGKHTGDIERTNHIKESDDLRKVRLGVSRIESLCLACLKNFSEKKLRDHPFFCGSICKICMDDFKAKVFAFGSDGKCFFCTMCGGEEDIAVCDNMDCPRVYCTACIKYIISPTKYEEILMENPWYCFLCKQDEGLTACSLVGMRADWEKNLASLYHIKCDKKNPSLVDFSGPKRKMRVLSLFDGIGTGLVVLKKLGIQLDKYYGSEINPDSIKVTFYNHGEEVIQMGDVRDITPKRLKEICPIDLLIGGSPCNDLSLANPKRRGLWDPEGTGVLFFEYCRIKKEIEKYNKKHHLFWFYENVASMPGIFRNGISKEFGRYPHLIDSADFSPQRRPRLYWTNIPIGAYEMSTEVLQDVLAEKCGRQALVKKIMTVTTRTNSLNQGKENQKPVLMNGIPDSLWVTELETIFGFRKHYTDANLSNTRRIQLIGKAWSVQTVTHILRPLRYFFEMAQNDTPTE